MHPTTTTSLLSLIDTSPFWSNFWADFLAGLMILALASWLFPKFLRWRDMPSVHLLDFKKRVARFSYTKVGDQWESRLRMVVKNRGNKTLEKYYWEIYVENTVSIDTPRIETQPGHATVAYEQGEKFNRIYGYMVLPIFPLDDVDFPFEVVVKVPEARPVTLYYFFRTEYGQSPFWSWIALATGKYYFLKKLVIR